MTKQQIFNKVAKHLLTQKKPAKDGMCSLITSRGLRCSVGALLPAPTAQRLERDLEVTSVGHLANDKVASKLLGLKIKGRLDFLSDLQSIHDTGATIGVIASDVPEYWKSELMELAKEHHLNRSILKKFD